MSPRQKAELELLEYFRPQEYKKMLITPEDIKKYFEWSEQGKYKEYIKLSGFNDGFNLLRTCKEWRGITMGLWEEGIMDGSVPYYCLLGGSEGERKGVFYHIPTPRNVVDFMKKELFKGIDAEVIERCYQAILTEAGE